MQRFSKLVVATIISLLMLYSCNNGSNQLNPTITEIQPESGPPGTAVTITGNDFSSTPADNSVTFDENSAPVNSATETEIATEVPDGMETGEAEIEVSVDGNTAAGPSFTVEMEAPGIRSVEPDSGTVGTEVTIQGMNFSTSAAENSINFAGTDAPVNGAAADQLITEVPQGATDGPIEVTVNGKPATGPDFDVRSPISNKVAYVEWIDNNRKNFYSVNPDGTENELLFGEDDFGTFDISPNGMKIVYVNSGYIYISNIDGTNEFQVSDSKRGGDVSWSPKGNKIAFSSGDEEGDLELFVINSDGTNLHQVTDETIKAREPEWSPDGSKIAFDAYPADNYEIFVVNADGTNLTQITTDPGHDKEPAWSPDGKRITFNSDRHGFSHIFTMNPDGSEIQQLMDNQQQNRNPTWSPDGSEIVFEGLEDDKSLNLYKINADGSGEISPIVTKESDERDPKWINDE